MINVFLELLNNRGGGGLDKRRRTVDEVGAPIVVVNSKIKIKPNDVPAARRHIPGRIKGKINIFLFAFFSFSFFILLFYARNYARTNSPPGKVFGAMCANVLCIRAGGKTSRARTHRCRWVGANPYAFHDCSNSPFVDGRSFYAERVWHTRAARRVNFYAKTSRVQRLVMTANVTVFPGKKDQHVQSFYVQRR